MDTCHQSDTTTKTGKQLSFDEKAFPELNNIQVAEEKYVLKIFANFLNYVDETSPNNRNLQTFEKKKKTSMRGHRVTLCGREFYAMQPKITHSKRTMIDEAEQLNS
jgi:hypothetical protein